ncbi:O-acetyl-ADP-ribose deacetylase [Algoriphagus sp. CAU 1675]|uniref:O-acetyl-ADP-ribose deacetylase n=1 Tax=Algoriphagus sp. CAU 1675 TaxID=3032597 RepID=UPI0023DCC394|nr:O-acetyl-ADP-ribose deacetylase [Algoriphagus sp. CAU 1675]MDF2156351.1 O-acetyl-ADP-ribose deacetylase [Algoriphagus sp. CAU 1675]
MKIELLKGDITQLEVDAIVNAANSSLLGGGGVDGAIHRAGGPEILKECQAIRDRQGGCEAGEAVITGGGKLKARYVIHTVGPVWQGGHAQEAEKLRLCYLNSLKIASEHQVKTIAFPNISTGIFGYPLAEAADIAIQTVRDAKFPEIEKVLFVCYNDENYRLYQERLDKPN